MWHWCGERGSWCGGVSGKPLNGGAPAGPVIVCGQDTQWWQSHPESPTSVRRNSSTRWQLWEPTQGGSCCGLASVSWSALQASVGVFVPSGPSTMPFTRWGLVSPGAGLPPTCHPYPLPLPEFPSSCFLPQRPPVTDAPGVWFPTPSSPSGHLPLAFSSFTRCILALPPPRPRPVLP